MSTLDSILGGAGYTKTSAPYTQPPIGSAVFVQQVNTAWLPVGSRILIEGAGVYLVLSKTVAGASLELQIPTITPTAPVSAGRLTVLVGPDSTVGYALSVVGGNTGTDHPSNVQVSPAGTAKFARVTVSAQAALATPGVGKLYGYVANSLLSDSALTTIAGVAALPLVALDLNTTRPAASATAIMAFTDPSNNLLIAWIFDAAAIALGRNYNFSAYFTVEDLGAVPLP